MLIACDNQVPFGAIQMMAARGFHCVFRAKNEKDCDWFAQAVESGAAVFISPDWDIEQLCKAHGKEFIRLKQGLRGIEVAHYVTRQLYDLKLKLERKRLVAA